MASPEIELERLLQEKHRRGERAYAHILGRVPVESLRPDHLHRWLVEWMNRQLSDIGVNSTGGVELPPLHFDLVRVRNRDHRKAHVFESDAFGFIVVTEPMVEEMLDLAMRFVNQNRYLVSLQIAPDATPVDLSHFLVFLQFCFVTTHEYSHMVRRHFEFHPPHETEIGEALTQTQELDADGCGIYHALAYLFHGDGRQMAATWLKITSPKVLDSSILDCFLYALMIQFCARWSGRIQVHADVSAEHPPPPMRIESALLFVEMWCREVGRLSTAWMAPDNLKGYFVAAANLFPVALKESWDELTRWLKSSEGEEYRSRIRAALDRIRTGDG